MVVVVVVELLVAEVRGGAELAAPVGVDELTVVLGEELLIMGWELMAIPLLLLPLLAWALIIDAPMDEGIELPLVLEDNVDT